MNVTEKKLQAVEEFKNRILSSKVRKDIAKIILFGSVLREEAYVDSDIDLMVVTFNSTKEIERVALDESFELLLKTGEVIEPMVCSIDDWRYPPCYLIFRTKEIGKEIYSMDRERVKKREIQGYLNLAQEYLENAHACLDANGFRATCDLAYNACELCVKGLLLFELDDLPSSHGGIISLFGKIYIESGKLPKTPGRRLHQGLETRGKARYKFHAEVDEENAKELIGLAHELISILSAKLGEID